MSARLVAGDNRPHPAVGSFERLIPVRHEQHFLPVDAITIAAKYQLVLVSRLAIALGTLLEDRHLLVSPEANSLGQCRGGFVLGQHLVESLIGGLGLSEDGSSQEQKDAEERGPS